MSASGTHIADIKSGDSSFGKSKGAALKQFASAITGLKSEAPSKEERDASIAEKRAKAAEHNAVAAAVAQQEALVDFQKKDLQAKTFRDFIAASKDFPESQRFLGERAVLQYAALLGLDTTPELA